MIYWLLFLYVVAALNLGLGFAAAVYLGWGPQDWSFLTHLGEGMARMLRRRKESASSR